MNQIEFLNKHWVRYHKLEEEFLEIEKTIPIDLENSNTFSYAYIKLLGAICNEFNECFKNFAKLNNLNCNSIEQYREFINDIFPKFTECETTLERLGCDVLHFKPFKYWTENNKPFWWEINNNIKHGRNSKQNPQGIENYKLANQYCILTALSGLLQLNVYFYTFIEHGPSYITLISPHPLSEIF